jgi:ATP-dependent DNA ligase
MHAQLAKEIEADFAMDHIGSDEWVVEQKLDGHRLLLEGRGTEVVGYNRNGMPYSARSLPRELATMPLPAGVILDGELLDLKTLEFWAFDLRSIDGSIDKEPMAVRRELLEGVLDLAPLPVHLVPQATDTRHKQTLVHDALTAHAEGVVFKKVSAPYQAGRNENWRKFKFVHTCDAIVTAVNVGGKESASLGLVNQNQAIVEVGKCSTIGKGLVSPGDIVEVRYLYATLEDRLYQPCLMHKRTDKVLGQCTLDQLVYTNREVLDLATHI